jgi:hypothetical protein
MLVSGSATVGAAPDEVWKALNDPAVLVRTIPGCQRLEEIGPDSYTMTVTAGVASIKGVYTGQVRLTDQQPPDTFVLKASGAGGPGTVSADVRVTLRDLDGSTEVSYDADAIVGGMIGGVGQRMLSGVAKKTAGEFFAAVDDVINGRAAPAGAAEQAGSRPSRTGWEGEPVQTVFEAPGAAAALEQASRPNGFQQGAVVGAVAALVGVLVGGWLAGRRRRD